MVQIVCDAENFDDCEGGIWVVYLYKIDVVRGSRSYNRRHSPSPPYGRSYSRSPVYYSPSPRGRHYSRSAATSFLSIQFLIKLDLLCFPVMFDRFGKVVVLIHLRSPSRSISPRDRRYRHHPYSRSPHGSRSYSRSPIRSRSPYGSRSYSRSPVRSRSRSLEYSRWFVVPSYAVKGYRELMVEVNDVSSWADCGVYRFLSTIGWCVVLIQLLRWLLLIFCFLTLIPPGFMNEVVCQCLYDCQFSSFEDESSKQRRDSSINL